VNECSELAKENSARQQAIAGCDALLRALRRCHPFGCGELKIRGGKFIRRVA
jgi:hypothetical protein